MQNEEHIYVVAGDAMQKLMKEKFPERKTIPFRDDLSKGGCPGFSFTADFIAGRASFWGVAEDDYIKKMSLIINIDTSRDYILCFGEDDCCKANLKFMLGYLKEKGYSKRVIVNVLDEYDLTVLKKYYVDIGAASYDQYPSDDISGSL